MLRFKFLDLFIVNKQKKLGFLRLIELFTLISAHSNVKYYTLV